MKYSRVLSMFYGTPLAIEPAKFHALSKFFAGLARGKKPQKSDVAAAISQKRSGGYGVAGKVAVIPVFGAIAQRLSIAEEASGGVSTEAVGGMIDAAMAAPSVRKILLQIDSPGGSVFGVQELGAKIKAANATKRVVAVADSVAASAAYWIGSQASEFFVTPSGMVGSIGVILEHVDESAAMEGDGLKTTIITAGEYKAEGHPSAPLSDDAREYLQAIADTYYASFVKAVAEGRGVTETKVKDGFGKGRMMTAKDAVAAGMVDGVRTVDSALKYMGAADVTARGVMNAQARCMNVSAS